MNTVNNIYPSSCIPTELVYTIAHHLDEQTLRTCLLVSKQFNQIAKDNSLWKKFLDFYPALEIGNEYLHHLTIREQIDFYKARCKHYLELTKTLGLSEKELLNYSILGDKSQRESQMKQGFPPIGNLLEVGFFLKTEKPDPESLQKALSSGASLQIVTLLSNALRKHSISSMLSLKKKVSDEIHQALEKDGHRMIEPLLPDVTVKSTFTYIREFRKPTSRITSNLGYAAPF